MRLELLSMPIGQKGVEKRLGATFRSVEDAWKPLG
jgi:hypothetical protein